MVFSDTLYDKAFAFKKCKKWRLLQQNFMIAVETLHYGCWYAIPLLMEGNRTGGMLLEGGQAGLKWVLDLANREYQESLDDYERNTQDRYHEEYIITFANQTQMKGWQDLDIVKDYCKRKGLVARGANFYPTFRHMFPMELSWILKTEEQGQFCETALDAFLAMDGYLGKELLAVDGAWQHMSHGDYKGTLPALVEQQDGSWQLATKEVDGRYEQPWPTAVLNDLETARLKRVKKNADVWLVDKFLYGEAVFSRDMMERQTFRKMAPEQPGFYPEGVILFNDSIGDVMVMNSSQFSQEGYNNLSNMLRDAFKRWGRPRQFAVCRQESYDFFKNICHRLDIELEMTDELPELMDIRHECIRRNGYPEDLDEDEDEDLDMEEMVDDDLHFLDGRGKKPGTLPEKCPDEVRFDKEMLQAFMDMFWQKHKTSQLTVDELMDMVNTCIAMPCTREAMDFIFAEVRNRMDSGEMLGVDAVLGDKPRRKKKR